MASKVLTDYADRMQATASLAADARFVREAGLAADVAAVTEPVIESLGFRLVLVRIMGGQSSIVEIMAERPDGSMSIDDCKTISNAVSAVLDVHDPMPGSYRLQIASPGIDRPLVRPSDFETWAGHEAKIELTELIDGRRRFKGELEGFADGEVRIKADLGDKGEHLLGLPIALIGEAKLVMTDDLIRESLRRSKHRLKGDETDIGELGLDDVAPDNGKNDTKTARSGKSARKRNKLRS
jgi:ribosome maturation factor RimP